MYTFVCLDVSNPKLIIIIFATHPVKQEKSNQKKQHGCVFQMSSGQRPNPFRGVPSRKLTYPTWGKGKNRLQICQPSRYLKQLGFFSLLNLELSSWTVNGTARSNTVGCIRTVVILSTCAALPDFIVNVGMLCPFVFWGGQSTNISTNQLISTYQLSTYQSKIQDPIN